ncbi:hypothetical protein GA0115260_110039 [Streptomyces sp. MnatMP-M27]|nr:hypothetical protein GA0115260_110039 [Streptomyces sp. MnatMP-M27]
MTGHRTRAGRSLRRPREPGAGSACPGTRIEQAATGVPLVHTYVLDPATRAYREGEVFTSVVKVAAPFPVRVDLGRL